MSPDEWPASGMGTDCVQRKALGPWLPLSYSDGGFSTGGSRNALRHPLDEMDGPLTNASRIHHVILPSFGELRK